MLRNAIIAEKLSSPDHGSSAVEESVLSALPLLHGSSRNSCCLLSIKVHWSIP